MYSALLWPVLLAGCLVSVRGTVVRFCHSKIGFRNRELRAKCLWHHSNVRSLLKCTVECNSDLNCRTFSFSHSKNICLGYSKALDAYRNNMDDVQEGETILFRTSRGDISSNCSQSGECNFQNSVCMSGVLLCEPGLHYSPKQNSCQRECSEYGEEMDVYEGLSIWGHNVYRICLSLSTCKQRCVQEKNFTCLTFDYDYSAGECLLSNVGYQDVEVKDRAKGDYNWALGQRRCK